MTEFDTLAPTSHEVRLGYDCMRVLSALRSAIVVVDDSGGIIQANARAGSVLGKRVADLIGRPIESVLAPMDKVREASQIEGDERFHVELRRSDGTVAKVGYQTSLVVQGEHPLFAVVFQDITPYERLRTERDRLMQIAGVSEVLPAVLHELKNPLAAIDSAVELLIEESPSPALGVELHAILGEIRRMKLTLEGLGSMDRELHAARFAAIDLALRETVRVMDRQAQPRGIELVAKIDTLPLLPFDPAVVRALAFNLLTNALHATRSGERITVVARLVKGDTAFELVVEDTGTGMTAEVRERCTELFFTTKSKGSGIGLALVSDVVGRGAGVLDITSAPGQGTSIRLCVPLERPRRSVPPQNILR